MAGVENLKPIKTKEKARELGAKGGKASGVAKRKNKAMKETLQMLLELTLKDGKVTDEKEIKSLADIGKANLTVDQAILLAQIKKALKGDTSSAVFIRDTSGNKLAEEVKVGELDDTIREIQKYVDKDE